MATGIPVAAEPRGFASLDDIVDNGYCIGCGLCVPLAPSAAIEMEPAANGHLRPRPKAPLPADEEQAILRLCPGINVDGKIESGPNVDPVWGATARVATGHARDPTTRFRASAGGVMTAINRHLLTSGRATFVLQVEPHPTDPLSSIPVLIRDPADLLTGAQSRYASCSPLTAIRAALELNEPFAVSLKPCDIAGVRNLQQEDARARELVVFTMAMFCGTVPDTADSLAMLERRGIDSNEPGRELVEFRWRGNGCPGPNEATLADGTKVTATYGELWNEHRWSTQFRCKICPDAIGLQADIATGDAWDGGSPTGESAGSNAIIAHTPAGVEVLAECEAAGLLALEAADAGLLSRVQPHHVRLRQTFMTRVAAASEGGLPTPKFVGLCADEAAGQLDTEVQQEIRQGTLARVRTGQADERVLSDYGSDASNQTVD